MIQPILPLQEHRRYYFSSTLAAWMKRHNLDRKAAAAYLQTSPGELRRWLSGSMPRQDTIEAVLERIKDK